jgi:hypothetical protein
MHQATPMNRPPFVQGLLKSIEDEVCVRRPAHRQPTMGRAYLALRGELEPEVAPVARVTPERVLTYAAH